jgi:hypothetical protein
MMKNQCDKELSPVQPEPMLFGDVLSVEELFEIYHSMLRIRTSRDKSGE